MSDTIDSALEYWKDVKAKSKEQSLSEYDSRFKKLKVNIDMCPSKTKLSATS